MPIYEYECTKCGRITEAMQKFSDPPLVKCIYCHGKLRKLISMSTFHLKGTGWYVTDYARNKGISKKGTGDKSTETEKKEKTEKTKPTKENSDS